MPKIRFKFVLAGLLLAALLPAVCAQDNAPKTRLGKVEIGFDRMEATPGLVHLSGHAWLSSEDYDFYAADIQMTLAPGTKTAASGLRRAVAEGGAAPGTQIVAHIRQPLQSQSFEIYADHAVYVPDYSRPSGGAMTFTGHVKVITRSGFLAVPSVATTDTATVLLGIGPDYPAVSTGPGHITLTPAQ